MLMSKSNESVIKEGEEEEEVQKRSAVIDIKQVKSWDGRAYVLVTSIE